MTANVRRLYRIVRPSGRRRLAMVLALVVMQAVMQTLAVFSLLPLLAAAADMNRFRESAVGRMLVDAVGGGSDRDVLIRAGLSALTILVAGNLVALAAERARARYAYHIGHRLRMDLLRWLFDRRYEYFTRTNSSVLLKNLMEDSNNVAAQLLMPALDVLARGMLVLLLVILVAVVEPWVVLAGAAVLTGYYLLVMRAVHRSAERTSEAIKQQMRGLYFQVYELLSGAKPILAAERKPAFLDRVERASRATAETFPKLPMFSAIPRSGLEIVVFGGMIAWVLIALATGGDLVALLPRMGVVAVVAYRLMPSVQALFSQTAAMVAGQQALEEVTALIEEQESWSDRIPVAAREAAPLRWEREIRFDKVSFAYAGANDLAIRGVSFAVGKGERVAFVGATGSGKSTLIDLLLGLLIPTEGRILVDGQPLTPELLPAWRRAIGYVPQELFLLDGTVAQNIAFGFEQGEPHADTVAKVAELAQATEFIEDGRSRGFDAAVGERGVRLSGGQRQRLALARALYAEPSTLVLDEATSALDPRTEQKVIEALAQGHERLTIVTVTHRLNTVIDYDRIHYVEQGRLVASGDYATLIASDASFRDFAH